MRNARVAYGGAASSGEGHGVCGEHGKVIELALSSQRRPACARRSGAARSPLMRRHTRFGLVLMEAVVRSMLLIGDRTATRVTGCRR